MSREQIRVRVDSEQWESWRQAGEGNTELLNRILSDWQQQRRILAALTDLDPNPSQALGRLLASHELLSTAAVTIEPVPATQLPVQPSPEPSPSPAAEPTLIDGIENNGDDW